jgi:hypothetical protein
LGGSCVHSSSKRNICRGWDSGRSCPHGSIDGVDKEIAAPAALFRKLENEKVAMGLINMWGCTSVLVISRQGVWWSHFWENPYFGSVHADGEVYDTWAEHVKDQRNGRVSVFQRNVLEILKSTADYPMNQLPQAFPGLASAVGPGKAFADGTEPQVIITTSTKYENTDLGFPEHVSAIRQVLKNNVFKDVGDYKDEHFIVIKYRPNHRNDGSTDPPDEGGDPDLYPFMNDKFMLQYDPQQVVGSGSQKGKAALELWAEISTLPVFRTEWDVSSVMSTSSASKTSTAAGFITIRVTSSAFPSMTLSLNKPHTPVTTNSHPTASPTPSSAPPPPPPPPTPTPGYAQGICRMHIIQWDAGGDSLTMMLTLFDGSNPEMFSTERVVKLNKNTAIRDIDTSLNYDVDIDLVKKNKIGPLSSEGSRNLHIAFGDVAKVTFGKSDRDQSKMPHCNVGEWDIRGPFDGIDVSLLFSPVPVCLCACVSVLMRV